MLTLANTLIAQCPCPGGGAGGTGGTGGGSDGGSTWLWLVVALAIGLWWTIRSLHRTWKGATPMTRTLKASLVVGLVAAMALVISSQYWQSPSIAAEPAAKPAATQRSGVPKLVDLGSKSCIPCKMMAPILDDLKKDFAGKLEVEFIDVSVRENLPQARKYNIQTIPTQIFLDADGKELGRHEGFISRHGMLAAFAGLGYEFAAKALEPAYSRMDAKADERAKNTICYMCDGNIPANTAATVKTDKGDVRLCGTHCYFIMYSCLTEDKAGFEKKLSVTDFATGKPVAAVGAHYLQGLDEKTGRPWTKAFADKADARKELQSAGGSIIGFDVLAKKELAARCGFCDRSCYSEDSAVVKAGGVQTSGCCSHCALGVAVRAGRDIEVQQPDRLSGEMITIKTAGGYVASIEPATAVAWFGKKKSADGKFVSAGCFHQGFFTSLDNLKKWAQQNPTEVGHMVTIDQALADKMALTPQQVQNACKIGQCAPK